MENLILHSMQAKMIIFWIDATDVTSSLTVISLNNSSLQKKNIIFLNIWNTLHVNLRVTNLDEKTDFCAQGIFSMSQLTN